MKIAILTHPLGRNYGGIMQAYALQKTLVSLGHKPITVDNRPVMPKKLYVLKRSIYRSVLNLLGKRKGPINIEAHYSYLFQNTDKFVKEYIKTTETLTSTSGLQKHFFKNDYDAVIVGSDQTWRPKYVVNIYNYYLDFLTDIPIKKLAYASSFGVDVWEYTDEETRVCAELALKFDAISVREESGIKLCEKYLKVKSKCVLDPTLLLQKEDYLELIGDRYKNDSGSGVFTYFLDANEEKKLAAEKLAKKLNTHTYQCQGMGNLTSNNLEDYKMPQVEDWLASFANAQFIMTDSFHGMVFSIIFQKPFIVINNKQRGSARFHSLLSSIDMLERLIDQSNIVEALNDSNLMSLNSINTEKLLRLRSKSLSFLKSTLIK